MTSRSSPNLKPTLWDALVALAVIALAVVVAISVYSGKQDSGELTMVVSIGGAESARFSLSDLPDTEIPFSNNGYTLYVSPVYDHGPIGVHVAHSNCPSQDCVHTGTITRAGQSIVCLPAQIVIHLEGTPTSDAPDVIVG